MEMFKVCKRNGAVVDFDTQRIDVAIGKALTAARETNSLESASIASEAKEVTNHVVQDLLRNYLDHYKIVSIETIQDTVEKILMKQKYYATAKAYILYRNQRAADRQQKENGQEKSTNDQQKSIRDEIFEALVEQNSTYFNDEVVREFVYYRTYSRWIEAKGRREVWSETVDRYMDFMKENLGTALGDDIYTEVHDAILKGEVMPSMRLLQFAGDAARRCNVCVYNCAFTAPESFKDLADILYISTSGSGCAFTVEQKHVDKFPIIKTQKQFQKTLSEMNHYVIDDSKEGWADAFQYGLEKWYNGEDVVFDYERLRPAGARLKTMGGRSSGPGPLKELLDFTRDLILKKQGSKLSTLNMHDIICKIAQIIISGGIRRSAMLSLSDLNDAAIRDAKTGPFWASDPQRCLANNSAAYNSKPTMVEFMHEWLALAESGSGERGIFNRGSLAKTLPIRRLELLGDEVANLGPNPCCVSGDTWVHTVQGPRQVRNLVHKDVKLIINGYVCRTKQQADGNYGFFKSGEKKTYGLFTRKGYGVSATLDHRFLIRKENPYREEWTPLSEIKEGDKILLSHHLDYPISGAELNYRWSQYSGTQKEGYETAVGKIPPSGSYYDSEKWKVEIYTYEMQSREFHVGFLEGIFRDSNSFRSLQYHLVYDGSGQEILIPAIQRILIRLGIVSSISLQYKETIVNRETNLIRSTWTKTITISDNGLKRFSLMVSKNFKGMMDLPIKNKYRQQNAYENGYNMADEYVDTVYFVKELGEEPVYDVTVDCDDSRGPEYGIHEFCANGIRAHNCEINLKPMEFCNLSEVVCRPKDTEKSLMEKIRIATIIGTYQSTLTKFNYISPKWRENQIQERLLGVSLTGQWDCPEVRDPQTLYNLKQYAIYINKQYSRLFGISQSTAITTVKPSGTVSQLMNTSSGMHARFSPYYIRRIRISATDPLLKLMKDQGYKINPEVGQIEPNVNTYVLDFYVKSPDGATCTKDLTAIQQLDYSKMVKTYFCEHNTSVTVYVKEDEWMKVGQWIWDNWDTVTGLSFFPHSDHIYSLSPYESISKEEYEAAVKTLKPVDFSKLVKYEKEDQTDVKREVACSGGVCEL